VVELEKRKNLIRKPLMEKQSLVNQARKILEGESLKSKLIAFENPLFDSIDNYTINKPGRNKNLSFSEKKYKFPKNFENIESRVRAIHAFANHELLAIEIMCLALLKFDDKEDLIPFKKSLINTIHDEQKHLKLYIDRIQAMGYDFGDFPLNDYFWAQSTKIERPAQFSAMMSLTFEAANLDFSHHYMSEFRKVGDIETAKVMKIVFDDEINHVHLGLHFMNSWKERKKIWDYYLENLIFPLTPARSKGIYYQKEFRVLAGFDEEYIESLESFDDGYKITNRKKCTI